MISTLTIWMQVSIASVAGEIGIAQLSKLTHHIGQF